MKGTITVKCGNKKSVITLPEKGGLDIDFNWDINEEKDQPKEEIFVENMTGSIIQKIRMDQVIHELFNGDEDND